MIKVLINGCCGKMGSVVAEVIRNSDEFEIFGGYDRKIKEEEKI